MADRRGSDDHRDGSGSGKTLKSSDRPGSSTRASDRSPNDRRRHRSPQPHSSSNHRHRSRDRNHNNGSSKSTETLSRASQAPDLIPRFRDKQATGSEPGHRSSHRSRSRDRDRNGDRHDSPSVSKRHRSRTPSPASSHRKRSRRDGSSSRHERDRAPDSEARNPRESASHRPSRPHKSSSRSDRPRSRSPSRRDRSPRHRDRDSERRSRRDSRDSRHHRRDKRSRSRSPRRGSTNDAPRKSNFNAEGCDASKETPSQARREGDEPTNAASRNSRSEGVEGGRSGGRGGPDLKLPPKPPVDDRGRYSRSPQHRPQPGAASPPLQGFSRSNWSGQPRSPHHHSRSRYDRDTRPRSNGSSHTLSPTRQGDQHRRDNYRRGSRDGLRGPILAPRGPHRESDYFNGQRNSPSSETRAEQMDVDGQPPLAPRAEPPMNAPSGPASQNGPKFSFALKSASKIPATPTKPEISQVFSFPPKREEPSPSHAPVGAPTQPASYSQPPRKTPDGPRIAPRMRKVKKVMRRLKPRPTLSTDMVESASVFYRKPGNESVVGSGTYGQVFKGLNVYTKELSALKRIRMDNEKDGFPVTAIREIKLLQSLRHVNVVNLQEVMVEKNDCFMVFEYLSHDLTGLLNHPSFVLQPAQKKHLAKQLFEGMDYLHTRGVLHRDIKAANILVSKDGIIKIADFGLARFYAKRHQLDYTNRVITIWYRSPELLLGETKYTAAVDVWSTACVMMEIFTRSAIFPGDGSDLSQLDKIYNIMGTPNRHDWPGLVDMAWFELMRPTIKRKSTFEEKYKDVLTPAAFDLMLSMFAYDPEKRPTSAQVLEHPYFTAEEPLPKQATELADIGGDWHEFESKALRKERERKERDAARKAAAEKKRGAENASEPEAKRVQIDAPAPPPSAA